MAQRGRSEGAARTRRAGNATPPAESKDLRLSPLPLFPLPFSPLPLSPHPLFSFTLPAPSSAFLALPLPSPPPLLPSSPPPLFPSSPPLLVLPRLSSPSVFNDRARGAVRAARSARLARGTHRRTKLFGQLPRRRRLQGHPVRVDRLVRGGLGLRLGGMDLGALGGFPLGETQRRDLRRVDVLQRTPKGTAQQRVERDGHHKRHQHHAQSRARAAAKGRARAVAVEGAAPHDAGCRSTGAVSRNASKKRYAQIHRRGDTSANATLASPAARRSAPRARGRTTSRAAGTTAARAAVRTRPKRTTPTRRHAQRSSNAR